MTGECLLDTNILTAWAAHDAAVLDRLSERNARPVLCAVVTGEALAGVEKLQGIRREQLRQFYENIVRSLRHLAMDLDVARQYAITRDILRRQGTPIPENDIWIAACAIRHDIALVSRDMHFKIVPGVHLENW